MDRVNLSTAAELCNVGRRTVARLHARGAFPGAIRTAGVSGAWLVPFTDLLAAGLRVDATQLRKHERFVDDRCR